MTSACAALPAAAHGTTGMRLPRRYGMKEKKVVRIIRFTVSALLTPPLTMAEAMK
jgi:hypothetical protein